MQRGVVVLTLRHKGVAYRISIQRKKLEKQRGTRKAPHQPELFLSVQQHKCHKRV
jgi:hypothetical protein